MNSTNNILYRLVFAASLVAFAASLAPCFDWASFAVGAEREIDGVLFSEDGKTLIRYPEDKEGEVYFIPEGVETIGENAFKNSSVLSIVIPEGTATIGDGAFAQCRRLETVVFPKSLVSLGESAFCDVDALSSVEVAEGNPVFQSKDGILYSKDGKTLIKCPAAYRFLIRDGMVSFDVFGGVECIEKKAFENCVNFKILKLPAEVKEIGPGAFDGCSQLKYLEVHANNANFSDGDNMFRDGQPFADRINRADVLYSKDGSVLIKCPPILDIDAFVAPAFVREISDRAFEGCSTLKSVEIREGVEKIGSGAFKGCSSLEWVSVPKSVASISDDAFESTASIHAYNGSYALEYAKRRGLNVAAFNDDFKLSPDSKTLLTYSGKGDVCNIPDGVETIAASAFEPDNTNDENAKESALRLKRLKRIVLSESVREFDELRLGACYSLEAIVVVKGNSVFRSVDGVLFSKDGKTLLRVPPMHKRKAIAIFAGVENIGPYAFCDCSSTTSLDIPNTVKTVDPKAFVGFGTLETINVAEDNPVYRSIDGVLYSKDGKTLVAVPRGFNKESVVVPKGVAALDEFAFSGLFTPTTVTFSEDVERIGANAFSGSRFLTVVAPQGSLIEQFIDRYNEDDARRYLPPFDKQYRITLSSPEGTSAEETDSARKEDQKINLADFQLSDDGKTLLKYVGKFIDKGNEARVPNSVEIIGDKAFAFRTDLKKIVLLEGLKVIGNRAFDNCMSLEELNIPNGVERIGVAPFSGTSLKSIVVPKSVCEISELAFSGASALRTVTFSADVEKLDNSAFIGTYFLTVVAPKGSRIEQFINEYNEDRAKRHDPSYDKEDQITFFPLGEPIDETVADYRFSDDGKKLVKYFGDAEEVRVPEGVEFIGRGAFENRATIKSLILPESVNEIGERAFVGLASEATITFSGDVEKLWNNAFVGNSFLTVVAPKASKIQQCIDDYNQKNEAYAKIKKDSRIAFVPLGEAPEEGVGDVQGDGTTTKVAVPDEADYQLSDDGKVLELYWGIDETFAVPEGVETINADAIRDPGTLTKVVLPASVTSVEKGAFASAFLFGTIDDSMRGLGNIGSARGGNRSLTSIEVAEDNPNYRSIDGVLFSKDGKTLLRYPAGREQEKYVVPEGVETIGPNAFSDCYSLTEIELPSSVTAIESGAFQSCSLLKSIVLPDGITAIKNRAFGGCYSLESVVFPKNLTMIESFAFSDCVALAELVLPESLKTIGEGAFAGCVALKSVRIPRGVDGISVRTNPVDYAKRQKELEKVGIYVDYITPSPDSKGRDVFEGCSSLAAIDVDEENSAFRSIDGVLFSKDCKTLIRCPEAKVAEVYVTPEGVETIEEQAFSYCVSINRIVVSEGVTRLMHNAFSYCDSLKSLSVPASVPYLSFGLGSMSDFLTTGSNALASIEVAEDNPKYRSQDGVLFSRDGKILIKYPRGKDSENYVVPNSVEEIGEGAFMSCSQLKTLAIPEQVVKIGENAFAGCVGLTSVDVDENNPAYCSIDGALFSRNESAGNLRTLVKYPSASGRESYVVPSFVEEVAINAFNGASSLKSIEVPQNVEKLEIDGVWNCPNLESINVVGNNRRYRSQDGVLFYRNGTVLYQYPAGKSDENYVVPRGVDSIGPIGFGGCDTLKTIKLPEDLRRIGIGVFDGCDALTSIEVDEKNEYYRSVDGVLFSKDNNSLVKYPKGKVSESYVVPDDVVKIGARAFDGCSGLTSIALSDGVEEIGSNAFANCSNLKTIEIPASVVSISQDAFPVDQELTVRAPKGSEAEAFVRRAAPRSGLKLETIERKPRKPKKPVLPKKNALPEFID